MYRYDMDLSSEDPPVRFVVITNHFIRDHFLPLMALPRTQFNKLYKLELLVHPPSGTREILAEHIINRRIRCSVMAGTALLDDVLLLAATQVFALRRIDP